MKMSKNDQNKILENNIGKARDVVVKLTEKGLKVLKVSVENGTPLIEIAYSHECKRIVSGTKVRKLIRGRMVNTKVSIMNGCCVQWDQYQEAA